MTEEQMHEYLEQLAVGLVRSVGQAMVRRHGTELVGPAEIIAVLTIAKAHAEKAYDLAAADTVAHFVNEPETLAGGEVLLALERRTLDWANARAAAVKAVGS